MTKKCYYLPAAQALAIRLFAPRHAGEEFGEDHEDLPAVEYLDYGIIGGIQITSLSRNPLFVTNVQVNADFQPTLYAVRAESRRKKIFQELVYPQKIPYGGSFFAITRAPLAEDWVKRRCYENAITAVTISTDQGCHQYEIREIVAD